MRWSALVLILVVALPASTDKAEMFSEAQIKEMILARELETMGLTVGAATLIRDGHYDRALKLLDQRFASSVSRSAELVDSGTQLQPGKYRSLRDAPIRATRYAERQALPALAEQTKKIARHLSK